MAISSNQGAMPFFTNGMNILIATGIYPPDIGGPAQYAANIERVWKNFGHRVDVRTFRYERIFPTGLRHILYLFKCLPAALRADFIFVLDTWSAALPAVFLGWLFRKKTVIRTGGDFLWESYVERTNDMVLFREFYKTRIGKLSRKERFVFSITKWVLHHASAVVFSTKWQKFIWNEPYKLTSIKTNIVENYYGLKEVSFPPEKKDFIVGTRPLKWKNNVRLKEVFGRVSKNGPVLTYDSTITPFNSFVDKLARSYAVILASLGDISPNLILDAIRHNKPFIVTRETGLYERIKECALFVDPENVDDMALKIRWLSDPVNYKEQKKKVEAFTFTHTWENIADEFLSIYKRL